MTGQWFREFLACPDCRRDLLSVCACGFTAKDGTPPDLRPQRAAFRNLSVPVLPRIELGDVPVGRPVPLYTGPPAQRDSSELFSAASAWLRSGAALLDLGCGPRDQSTPAQHYGLRYAGIDYSSPAADLLGDAHAIPFRDGTFDAVLSYAVFEHLHNPYLAAAEVARVLRPGGIFFGVVSQGEPFHESYFHHTTLGVLAILGFAGLAPQRLWPSYDTLHSLATMGRYPRPQRLLIELVYRFGRAVPFLAPRKFFRWPEREKQIDELHRAAGIAFVAEKVPA
ncbi:MAG TPA: class I SAM-dependent methyltransferase [Thermoanaerobaculia bacterium]|nr:class I SAM-dependent methyltransferase [Thermoanaerobaculia bacterium]